MKQFMISWAKYKHSLFVIQPWHIRNNELLMADLENELATNTFYNQVFGEYR